MPMINRIEAQQRREGAPVASVMRFADQIAPVIQPLFHLIQASKNFLHCFVVRFLAARKACPVHAVIKMAINEIVDPIDFAAQFFRIKNRRSHWYARESGVEHTNDLRRLVVHDGAPLAVPERRYGHFAV